MATSDERATTDALRIAGERRVELKEAVSRTERAAAGPMAMPSWRDYLLEQTLLLQAALAQHVEEVERPGGLLSELREHAPRLINKIDRVQNEHPGLCLAVEEALQLLRSDTEAAQVRSAVSKALFDIVRHRQHGSDLVYEGYNVDIGGG